MPAGMGRGGSGPPLESGLRVWGAHNYAAALLDDGTVIVRASGHSPNRSEIKILGEGDKHRRICQAGGVQFCED